jgi:hypothetical protein
MANATITVLEADGVTQTDVVVLDVGRQAAAASKSVALATEDKTVLDALKTALEIVDNAISGNEMQVDVLTLSAGAIPAGATNIAENEDVASADGDRGVKMLFKRLDTPANSSGTDGDYEQPQMSAGRLWTSATVTSVVPGTAATNLGKAEDAAHTSGDVGVMALAVRQSVQSDFGADGDYVPLSIDDDGALRVSGAGGGTQYTEDAAAAANPVGTVLMGIRRDTLTAAEVSDDGDNVAIKASSKGQLHVVTDSTDPIVTAITGIAHDAVNTANPSLLGGHALAHGTNPTAVAAGDLTRLYANRAGVPWVIGGHPNVIVRANRIADADGAQTDAALIPVISAGTKIVITQLWTRADKNNSGNVAVKIGFGTANVPTPALAGVAGLLMDEDLGAGDGHQIGNGAGIVAIGGDGEDFRITCDDPAGGALYVGYSYYTIES